MNWTALAEEIFVEPYRKNSARPKIRCGLCDRKVKDTGLWQHYVYFHEIPGNTAKMLAEQDILDQGMDRRQHD